MNRQPPTPRPSAEQSPSEVLIHWPDGSSSRATSGTSWLEAAHTAGVLIPTGCMGGSCGACEIDVNGHTVRACISSVPASRSGSLSVELTSDPYW